MKNKIMNINFIDKYKIFSIVSAAVILLGIILDIVLGTNLDERFNGLNAPADINFILKGVYALFIAFLLVMLYISYRFRKSDGFKTGIISACVLIHNALLVYFVCVVSRVIFNDSSVAAIFAALIPSVFYNIVIFESIRENRGLLSKKYSFRQLAEKSIGENFVRMLIATIIMLLPVVVVSVFAAVQGDFYVFSFSIPFAIGLIISLCSAVVFAAPSLVLWREHKEKKNSAEKRGSYAKK